jgi:hypothetical protein
MNSIDLNLFPSQVKAISSQHKQVLMLVGRGYGKSYINALWIILTLLNDPGANCLLVAPTYQQAKEVVSYMSKHCEKIGLEYTINKVPTWCRTTMSDCKNIFSINLGSKHTYCRIGSADNPDNLRGTTTSYISVDEICYTSQDLYDAVLLPCLRGRGSNFNYRIFMTSSPAGASQSWVYRKFIEKPDKDTLLIQAPSYENWIEWSDEKVQYYKNTMSSRFFQQEIEAKCLEWSSSQVFYAYSESHKKELLTDEGKLYLSIDMNVDGLSSIVALVNNKQIYIQNEVVIKENGNAIKMAAEFHKLYSKRPNKTIYMTGDRSTKNRSATSDFTYHTQLLQELKRLGWIVSDRTLQSNPSVYDSSEMVNRKFEMNEIMIHPSCSVLIDDCVRGSWKQTLSDKMDIDKALCRFDCGDCLRYLVWDLRPGTGVGTLSF